MKIENGVLLSVSKEDIKNGVLEIPLGVKKIGPAACFDMLDLHHVDFPRPNTVKEIGEGAFCRCSNLELITIPEGVTTICDNAFSYCIDLKHVHLPESLKAIGNNGFARCYSLQSINLGRIEKLGSACFFDCTSLKQACLAYLEKSIPNRCFENCAHLENVLISSRVLNIGEKAFYECSSLKDVEFHSIKNVKNYTRGLQSIGDHAFGWCKSLEKIELPETVLNLGTWVFKGCKNLQTIKTALGSEKFNLCQLDSPSQTEIVK